MHEVIHKALNIRWWRNSFRFWTASIFSFCIEMKTCLNWANLYNKSTDSNQMFYSVRIHFNFDKIEIDFCIHRKHLFCLNDFLNSNGNCDFKTKPQWEYKSNLVNFSDNILWSDSNSPSIMAIKRSRASAQINCERKWENEHGNYKAIAIDQLVQRSWRYKHMLINFVFALCSGGAHPFYYFVSFFRWFVSYSLDFSHLSRFFCRFHCICVRFFVCVPSLNCNIYFSSSQRRQTIC